MLLDHALIQALATAPEVAVRGALCVSERRPAHLPSVCPSSLYQSG